MRYFVVLLSMLSFSCFFSQDEIVLTEENQNFLIGDRNSIVVTIPHGDPVIIEKQLKKEMKSWGGSFYINRGEYTLVQGKHKALGSGTINSYAKIKKGDDGYIRVIFTFDLGGVFLTSFEHAAQFNNISSELKDFAKETSLKSLDHQISIEKEKLGYSKKNLKLLEKEKSKLVQDINEYKAFIIAAEKNLENNIKNQGKIFENIQKTEISILEIEKKKKRVKKE
jgi:hypothetical protein